jgi:hypothetical protein
MALTWRPDEVTVVGFCGLPISAAAAMVAPVFESPTGRYFVGDPDSLMPPRSFLDRAELERQRQAGYLTLTDRQWARLPGGVVLYAHPRFVNPGAKFCGLSSPELTLDTSAGVHLAYVARARALKMLHQWGTLLVADANRILSGRPHAAEIERAMDASQRALFCAPPPEHKQLRVDAFISLAASYHVCRRPSERLYREMMLDFDELTISAIRVRAEAKAAGVRAYPLTASGTGSDPADGKRLSVTVSRAALAS